MYQDVMIAGCGGQGVLLAGKLLAWAGMKEGRQVTWFPSYGAEVRGGTANCTVIISSEEIGSPVVAEPRAMIIFNEASFGKFEKRICAKGSLFLNSSLVAPAAGREDIRRFEVRANDLARELGDIRLVNMIMIGAFLSENRVVSLESAIAVLPDVFPVNRHSCIPLNEAGLRRGYETPIARC